MEKKTVKVIIADFLGVLVMVGTAVNHDQVLDMRKSIHNDILVFLVPIRLVFLCLTLCDHRICISLG